MKQPIPVEALRFDKFTESERAVLQYALVSLADDTLADAEREEIDAAALPAAGTTFLVASLLAHELDEDGEDRPSLEALELLAACIAEGDAPLAAKMAAEAVAE